MDFQFIKVKEENRILRMTLARPPLNVLNMAMIREINGFLETLIDRTDLCALVIDGEGKMLCAGVDVPEHRQPTAEEMITTFHRMFRIMHKLPMPTVCAAHGGAYGGAMELIMFCDVVLAADNMKIGVPEITLGVFPPLAVAHLSRIVGANKAAEMIYTGAVIDAKEAHRIGLANHVYPADDFAASVDKFVDQFTRLSAFSLRQAKRAFQSVVSPNFERELDAAERIYVKDLMEGHDATEGLTAFMEKRKPEWTDK